MQTSLKRWKLIKPRQLAATADEAARLSELITTKTLQPGAWGLGPATRELRAFFGSLGAVYNPSLDYTGLQYLGS